MSHRKKCGGTVFKLQEGNTEESVTDPRGYPTKIRTVALFTQSVTIRTSKRWKADQWTGNTHRKCTDLGNPTSRITYKDK